MTVVKKYITDFCKKRKLDVETLMLEDDIVFIKDLKLAFLRAEYLGLKSQPLKLEPHVSNNILIPEEHFKDSKEPFKQFKSLSNTQKKIQTEIFDTNKFNLSQSLLIKGSCGCGKTVTGLEFIFKLRVKTLIISSRNAVNDQWKCEIKAMFPNLKISKRPDKEADIYIMTPQYLFDKCETINLPVDFIIYDEVHSLVSDKFSNVLFLPFYMKKNGFIKYLPYMLAMTATLPNDKSSEYKTLKQIFGKELSTKELITNIKVQYTDLRNHTINKGKFDSNYTPKDDRQTFDYYADYILDSPDEAQLKPTKDFKMIIITHTINDSIYCACKACYKFNVPVLIIRAVGESNYFLTPDKLPDNYQEEDGLTEEELPKYTIDDLEADEAAEKVKDYTTKLPEACIIVGTDVRLKEGFNCKNLTVGICTTFLWSEISRVQILGRIRRSSEDEALNNRRRFFMVKSGRIPSNLKVPNRRGPIKILYDQDYEKQLFDNENYECIDQPLSTNI